MKFHLTSGTIRSLLNNFACIVSFSIILVFEGCYSHSTISKGGMEPTLPHPGTDIRIERKYDTPVEVEGYHYVAVRESSGFVYGVGHVLTENGNEGDEFTGKLVPVSVDSSHTASTDISFGGGEVRCFDFVTSISLRVRFNEGDFVRVPAGAAHGIWYCGNNGTSGIHRSFSGVIPFGSINKIEVRETSVPGSFGLAAAIGAGVVVTCYAVVFLFWTIL